MSETICHCLFPCPDTHAKTHPRKEHMDFYLIWGMISTGEYKLCGTSSAEWIRPSFRVDKSEGPFFGSASTSQTKRECWGPNSFTLVLSTLAPEWKWGMGRINSVFYRGETTPHHLVAATLVRTLRDGHLVVLRLLQHAVTKSIFFKSQNTVYNFVFFFSTQSASGESGCL